MSATNEPKMLVGVAFGVIGSCSYTPVPPVSFPKRDSHAFYDFNPNVWMVIKPIL